MNPAIVVILSFLNVLWPGERGEIYHGSLNQSLDAWAPESTLAFDVDHYMITLDIDIPAETLAATTEIDLRTLEPADSIKFDFVGMSVSEVKEGGTPRFFTRTDSSIIIALGRTVTEGQALNLSIAYHGKPTIASAGFGRGLYIDSDTSNDAVTYTCSAPWGAKYWFVCQDNPADKATMDMIVTVPSGYEVISNGVLVSKTSSGPYMSFHWRETHPIATYLIALAASKNYALTIDTAVIDATPLPLYHWVLEKDSAVITPKLAGVKEIVEYFSELFYPYPFLDEKYAQVYAPVSGAMENQTCTHINTGAGWEDWGVITAHELSHSWWGNSAGFRRLKHVWLSEGLATYSAALWVEHRDGQEAYQKYFEEKIAGGYLANFGVSSYSILDPPWSLIYSELTYEKPAAVLHMLRRLIGDEDFFTIIRTYGARFKDSTALSEDFEAIVNEITGSDYSWFFDEWLRLPGHPQYMTTWSSENVKDSISLAIRVRQTQTWPPGVGLFRMPVEFAIVEGKDTSFVWFTDSLKDQTFTLMRAQTPSAVLFDPHGNLLKKIQSGVDEVASEQEPRFECSAVTFSLLYYSSSSATPIDISLYDVSGRRLSVLHNLPSSGVINLGGYPCGVYYLKLETQPSLHKVVLVK